VNPNLLVAVGALTVIALIGVAYWYYELRKMEKRRDRTQAASHGEPVAKKP
jgi:hypothetical protein